MLNKELKERLANAKNIDEVKDIVKDNPELDAERVWQEIEKHKSAKSEKLDLEELDSVSGGSDRDWVKDGCAATCEPGSWCWSNDFCTFWDVTYDNFWKTCPDGQPHDYENKGGYEKCRRCGHVYSPGNTGPFD